MSSSAVSQLLFDLFQADQTERKNHPPHDTSEYWALRERDQQRREQVLALVATDQVQQPEDCYYAALVLHHGGDVAEVRQAHTLASRAAAMGYRPARWLSAAALDRLLMYQGKPQKYGTQIVPDGRQYRVWPVDPGTTDAERAALDVRPLAQQEARAADLTRTEPMPDMAQAPEWLKKALSQRGNPDIDLGLNNTA